MRVHKKDSVNHYIVRGSLKMNKRFFARESMKAGSYLRILLGLEESYCRKVSKIERDGQDVVIYYGQGELVFLPNDFQHFFAKVRQAYGKEISGRIDVSMSYGTVDFLMVKVEF